MTLTTTERDLLAELHTGRTVVVNVGKRGPHRRLVPLLTERHQLVYIGRAGRWHTWPQSDWHNPLIPGQPSKGQPAVDRYRHQHLPTRPDLLTRIDTGELTAVALGCWCTPQPCHGDVLAELANQHERTTAP